jgi:hypothetical protein
MHDALYHYIKPLINYKNELETYGDDFWGYLSSVTINNDIQL